MVLAGACLGTAVLATPDLGLDLGTPDRGKEVSSVVMTSGPAATVESLQGRVRPRAVDGISALLLPYREDGRPDWDAYAACVAQTAAASIRPAFNMDTGYVHLLTVEERAEALRVASGALTGQGG